MKTDEVIALEIATLAELAKLAPERGSCGLVDNSRNVINAQIDVIAYRLTTDQVHDAYEGKCPDDMFLSLLHASDWTLGLLEADSDFLPSLEWRDLVKYAEGAELVDERAQRALAVALDGELGAAV